MQDFFRQLREYEVVVLSAIITITVIQFFYFVLKLRRDFAVSYRISVIGLPRAGKTALISAIFDQIFHSTQGSAFAPVGESTIDRINNQIMTLESRQIFEPTKDRDIFIFRFLYYVKRLFFLIKIRYEGEVVDFPGEMSASLLESADDGSFRDDVALFRKEFYSWVLSSKIHIFVIDLAQFYLASDKPAFAAQRAAEIRKTWQILSEEINRAQRSDSRRVALVFTKSDLNSIVSVDYDGVHAGDYYMDRVQLFGYQQAPPLRYSESDRRNSAKDAENFVLQSFMPIVRYFKTQGGELNLFFTSAYKDDSGNREGVADLVRYILPRGGF